MDGHAAADSILQFMTTGSSLVRNSGSLPQGGGQHAVQDATLAPVDEEMRSAQWCHGMVQVFNISQGISIRPVVSINHSSRPVISLASAFQSRRGGWAEDIGCELVSCDDEGSLRVWQAHNSSSYLEAGVSMQAQAPCCSLAVRKGFIVAGGADGCVRIYNLVRKQQQTAETQARSV